MAKRQTSIYLSEQDYRKLDKVKTVYEAESYSQVLKALIENEYMQILKYQNMNMTSET